MSERLYKDAHSKALKRSRREGEYKTHRNFEDQGRSTSRSPSNFKNGKRKIKDFLQRMREKEKNAKSRILDLRRFKILKGR